MSRCRTAASVPRGHLRAASRRSGVPFRDLLTVQQGIESCTRCPTLDPWRRFNRNVYGSAATGYLLVGEAPGYRSWRNGRRFTGPAGLFLRRALSDIGDSRYRDLEDLFYMTDVVKCHPAVSMTSTTNRSPRQREADACLGHLMGELQTLRPCVIITVGKLAARQVERALQTLPNEGDHRKPEVISFPHPSPRNQRTIRRHYASMDAFRFSVTDCFRQLIRNLRRQEQQHA